MAKEISYSIAIEASKGGVRISSKANVTIDMDASLNVLLSEVQIVGTSPEAIDYGDIGNLNQSLIYLRNMEAEKTVSITRSDADNAETMLPGGTYGPILIDGPLLGKLRLNSSSGSANVEVFLAQVNPV